MASQVSWRLLIIVNGGVERRWVIPQCCGGHGLLLVGRHRISGILLQKESDRARWSVEVRRVEGLGSRCLTQPPAMDQCQVGIGHDSGRRHRGVRVLADRTLIHWRLGHL
jgi:hypothetical protein